MPNKDPPCPVQPPTSPHLISLICSKEINIYSLNIYKYIMESTLCLALLSPEKLPGVFAPSCPPTRLWSLETYLSFGQSLKSIVDSKHSVAFCDSHPDSWTHGGVHSSRRGADVQHGNVKGALWATGTVEGRKSQAPICRVSHASNF